MPKDVFYKIDDEKRKRITKSALVAFTKDDYESLTVSSITDVMNILRTDFYYYFKDKDDVFIAIKGLLKSLIERNGAPKDENEALLSLFSSIFSQKRPKNRSYYLDLALNYNPNSIETFAKFLLEEYGNKNYSEKELILLKAKLHLFMILMVRSLKDNSKVEESKEMLAK